MRLPFRHLGSIDAFCSCCRRILQFLQTHSLQRAFVPHSQAGTQVLDYLFTLYVAQ